MGLIWDFLKIKLQYILDHRDKIYWDLILKSPNFSHLAHFGPYLTSLRQEYSLGPLSSERELIDYCKIFQASRFFPCFGSPICSSVCVDMCVYVCACVCMIVRVVTWVCVCCLRNLFCQNIFRRRRFPRIIVTTFFLNSFLIFKYLNNNIKLAVKCLLFVFAFTFGSCTYSFN